MPGIFDDCLDESGKMKRPGAFTDAEIEAIYVKWVEVCRNPYDFLGTTLAINALKERMKDLGSSGQKNKILAIFHPDKRTRDPKTNAFMTAIETSLKDAWDWATMEETDLDPLWEMPKPGNSENKDEFKICEIRDFEWQGKVFKGSELTPPALLGLTGTVYALLGKGCTFDLAIFKHDKAALAQIKKTIGKALFEAKTQRRNYVDIPTRTREALCDNPDKDQKEQDMNTFFLEVGKCFLDEKAIDSSISLSKEQHDELSELLNDKGLWKLRTHNFFGSFPQGILKMQEAIKKAEERNSPVTLPELKAAIENRPLDGRKEIGFLCGSRLGCRDDETQSIYNVINGATDARRLVTDLDAKVLKYAAGESAEVATDTPSSPTPGSMYGVD